MRNLALWISLAAAMLASSCTSSGLVSPLPDGGLTIREILLGRSLDDTQNGEVEQRDALPDATAGLHGYTRDAYTELDIRFPRLPNPILIMYVFPHLSGELTPVPGYSTMFPLYDHPVYALPGETQP